jgi:hypothetical protein
LNGRARGAWIRKSLELDLPALAQHWQYVAEHWPVAFERRERQLRLQLQ